MRTMIHSALAFALVSSTALTAFAADKKAAKTATKPAAAAAATTLKLDTATSLVKWLGSKKLVNSQHTGLVKLKSGQVEFNGDQLVGGAFEVDMNTIENEDLKSDPGNQGKLVGHLKSPDFFDTAKFPTAAFKVTSVKALKPAKAGDPTHEVTGDLTIKGKTNSVTFPAVVSSKDGKAEATAALAIDRTKWDLKYGSDQFFKNLGDKVINDEMKLDLKLVATK